MKTDNTRYIVLKINVNPDENEAIRRNCAGKSISATGRDLLLKLQPPAHRSRRLPRREGPRLGPMADMFPGRRGGAPVPLRL